LIATELQSETDGQVKDLSRQTGTFPGANAQPVKKSVAAVVTEYRPRSHADVIVGRILEGYSPNNQRVEPRTRLVSLYTDQVPENDLSRGLAAEHGFPIFPTVAETLTLGGDSLAVDAVLLIGEHGDYPHNERGQKLYPRYELFSQIVDVFRRSGRSVPVFCDKHLSYSWEKARQMYSWSRDLGFPMMAGSSIPVTVRTPDLQVPYGARLEGAVSVAAGPLESYGFHALETLQCMVERRAGGETGVAAVRLLEDQTVWDWRDSAEGVWSAPLIEAALARSPSNRPGRPEDNCRNPAAFLVEYRDGLKAAVLMLNGHTRGWMFAAWLAGQQEPLSTSFGIQGRERRDLPHFDGLVHALEEFFVMGQPVYPVERTLLTTGVLAFAFDSREQGQRVETPELDVEYRAPETVFYQRA
jgi:hypothetical protein